MLSVLLALQKNTPSVFPSWPCICWPGEQGVCYMSSHCRDDQGLGEGIPAIPPPQPLLPKLQSQHIKSLDPLPSTLPASLCHLSGRAGFLPAKQWGYIRIFTKSWWGTDGTCSWCRSMVAMDLKDGICHSCFLRDKGNKTPFLIVRRERVDPGELPTICPSCASGKRCYRSVTICADDGLSIPCHRTITQDIRVSFLQAMPRWSIAATLLRNWMLWSCTTRSSDGDRPEISTIVPFRLSVRKRASNTWLHFLCLSYTIYCFNITQPN